MSDRDKALVELYNCLLNASGCVRSLSALSRDLSLQEAMPGLPHVERRVKACLEKHSNLRREIEMEILRKEKEAE